MTSWRSGSGVGHINRVILYAKPGCLILGTVRGYIVLVCSQPLEPTQLPTLSGTGDKCQGAVAAGKVTVGLASHRPCVTDCVITGLVV